jgi:septum formation protein
MIPSLVLASTSKYRARLLERLGLPFTQAAPGVDEAPYKHGPPVEIARRLAVAKAEAVARRFPDALVLGADQVCALDDALLDKPGSDERARAQLARLAGRTHDLVTALAVVQHGRTAVHVETTRLTMRALEPDEIARYVERDQPLDCAGSYKIESLGIALFTGIASADFTAIEGLPLLATVSLLREHGLDPLQNEKQ